MNKTTIYLLLIVVSCLSVQCKKQESKQNPTKNKQSSVKYAKGFDISLKNGKTVLTIKRAFQNSNQSFEYVLSNETNMEKNSLKVPVERLVVTSTSHIPMMELLGAETAIVGFPTTRFISSSRTRALVTKGHIKDIGSEQQMNTETLIDLQPELIVGFSLHPNNKVYETIKKANIPVVFNGEWLEETPLGRAEWIKFFGALLNKQQEADSIFNQIETKYLNAKALALKATQKPTVMSGSMFKDVWYVPAGKSFIATFFKDAQTRYLWNDTDGTGSLSLNFEAVLDKAQHADFWIGCGMHTTRNQLLQSSPHLANFICFKNHTIYTNAALKGETGGLMYFELAPVRPDLVLKDVIKITHPDLLQNYELTFFKQMK